MDSEEPAARGSHYPQGVAMSNLRCAIAVVLLIPACVEDPEATTETDGAAAEDSATESEEIDDDPRCQSCFEVLDGTRADFVCGDQGVDCGVYLEAEQPYGIPFPTGVCESEDSTDCTPRDEHNAEVIACAIELATDGARGFVRYQDDQLAIVYERTIHFNGDGTGYNITDNFLDQSVQWDPSRLFEVNDDLPGCGEPATVELQWTCIENNITAATVVDCTSGGDIYSPE
jgi:hypothetical protein